MTFNWNDINALLSQLEDEANEQAVDCDRARKEALRLMALYPGMANILAPIAERHSRQAA
jgi:hypothetical protein